MRKKLSNEELMNSYYINIGQISQLFDVGLKTARKIFVLADQVDDAELKEYRVEENKVRTKTVLKIQGITYNDLKKRICE